MFCAKSRARLEPLVLLIFRVTVGIVMAVHGWQKLTDIPTWTGHLTAMGVPFPQLSAYLSVAGEFGGGLGLIFGLLTPVAAFGVFCTMAVAVFKVHFANGLLAKNNGFEYPLVLMTAALYFMARGSGPFGLDTIFCKKCGDAAKS